MAGNSVSSSIPQMNRTHQHATRVAYVANSVFRSDAGRVQPPCAGAAARRPLKIDTQGYEMAVLQGAERLLPRLPRSAARAVSDTALRREAPYVDLIHRPQKRGFELWNVILAFVDPESGRLLQLDG